MNFNLRFAFILSEFTDIPFEVKAVLCLDFYASIDVFLRQNHPLSDCGRYSGGAQKKQRQTLLDDLPLLTVK